MTAVRILIALAFGLVFGSFLTVVVHRVPTGESLVRPRSRCPSCGAQLRNTDNIPVVSWLLLRGRCRSCGAPISILYPLTELATGALFVGAALEFERIWLAALVAPFLGLMFALSVIDLRHRIIPNRIVYPCLVVVPAYLALGELADGGFRPLDALIGFLSYGGGLLIVALVSPRGMGMGDVKLAALIGMTLGALGLRYVAVAAGAAVALGGVVAIVALAAGAGRKKAIPFGPFLAAGAVLSTFLAPQISAAYLHLFAHS
jgi:leader peptidase (prepilin peptidase)/N-methyltransferase